MNRTLPLRRPVLALPTSTIALAAALLATPGAHAPGLGFWIASS